MRTGQACALAFLVCGACGNGDRSVAPPAEIVVNIVPSAVTVGTGGTQSFSATVTDATDSSVAWSILEGPQGGTIAAGVYTAPVVPGTFHVVATSNADRNKSAMATVNVIHSNPVTITVEPDHLTFEVGTLAYFQFKAHVTGTADTVVTWSVEEGVEGGTIDASGGYKPSMNEGIFHVVATSHADPTKTASAVVISSGMFDHGGPVAPTTRTFALWWGDTNLFKADARAALENLLRGVKGSSYLAIANEYMRGAHATTSFAGSLFDTTPPPTYEPTVGMVTDAACRALDSQGITPREGDLVFVNTSTFPSNLTNHCAWHYWGICHGQNILIAYLPNAAGSWCEGHIDFCRTGSSMAAISITLLGAHELMEAITDPFISAWYIRNGWEIVDKCGEPVCISLATGTFAVPTVYSAATRSCVP